MGDSQTSKRKSRGHQDYYDRPIKGVDFRKHPDRYRVGVGEQGVLMVEPYKSEILPHWKFKTPDVAEASATRIYKMFRTYLKDDDFVGADMARKFLQMGFTRSRRYANHKSGQKWSPAKEDGSRQQLPDDVDPEKAESARVFYAYYERAKTNPDYLKRKQAHQAASKAADVD